MLTHGLAALSSLHTVEAEGGGGGRILEAHGAGRFLQISSSSLRFEWRFAAGVPVVGNIDVKEQGRSSFRRMSNDMRLRVATNAYLAGGGDGFHFIQSCTFCTIRRTRLRTFKAIETFLRSDSSDAKASLNALTLAATVGGGEQGGGGFVAETRDGGQRLNVGGQRLNVSWVYGGISQTRGIITRAADYAALVAQAALMRPTSKLATATTPGWWELQHTTDPCLRHWPGVKCEQNGSGVVVEVVLSRTALTAISPLLGTLQGLTKLDIHENDQLRSTIPTELGALRQLRVLMIAGNAKLSGSIPTEMGQLLSTQDMYIHGNVKISGTIPKEIGQCPELLDLQIFESPRISGTISAAIFGELISLKYLYIHTLLRVSGTISPMIGRLSGLRDVELHTMPYLSGTVRYTIALTRTAHDAVLIRPLVFLRASMYVCIAHL